MLLPKAVPPSLRSLSPSFDPPIVQVEAASGVAGELRAALCQRRALQSGHRRHLEVRSAPPVCRLTVSDDGRMRKQQEEKQLLTEGEEFEAKFIKRD